MLHLAFTRLKLRDLYLVVLVFSAPTLAVSDCQLDHRPRAQPCAQTPIVLAQRPTRLQYLKQRERVPRPLAAPLLNDSYLSVNAGFVGIFNRFSETLRYGMEYRWKPLTQYAIRPAAGVISAENDASYVFLGLRRDFFLGEHWLLTGSFDAGYFEERDELNLGLELEFRSGLEAAYQFDNRYRIGVALYHLSNGGFGKRNPGTESVVLSLTAPIISR